MDKRTITIVIGISAVCLLLYIGGLVWRRRLGQKVAKWEGAAVSTAASAITIFLSVMAFLRRSEDLLVASVLFALAVAYLWAQTFGEKLLKRKRVSLAVVPLLAIALVSTQFVDCSYEGHSLVGQEAHEALLNRDATGLLSLISPEEVKGNALTVENVQRFIDDYVFRGSKNVTVMSVDPAGPDFPADVSYWFRDYRLEDGSIKRIGFHAHRDGYLIHVVALLLDGNRKRGSLADVIERDLEILNSTGIKGVYHDSIFETWSQFAASVRRK